MAHTSAQPHGDPEPLDEPAAALAGRKHSAMDRALLRAGKWLALHPRLRALLVAGVVGGALAFGIVMLIFPGLADGLQGFGYAGIFAINLVSTVTVAIPVPGLTATAQALIIREGKHSAFPWLVGLMGGLGMGLGEITAYYAGYLGAELAKGHELRGPAWFRRAAQWIMDAVVRLMRRWGMVTLFVLSAVPNPLFEVAGLTAGSVRLSFRRFLIATVAGKVLRGLLLAYIGTQLRFV
ncbi:MAG: VTT domain-containing protein [Dehalococcoidia bacterium]